VLGARVGAPGCRRVLVSGAADTAMLALVLRATRARPAARAPQVAVVDRCRTPLSLCERYGARAGLDVEGRVLDLLAPAARAAPEAPFDLVCTHSLLALVPPGRRGDLVAAWRAQLRPGGVVVSTARLDSVASDGAAPADVEAFAERALAAARACATPLGVEPGALAALARGYAARLASWPLATAEALAALLEAGGFALEELRCVEVAGALGRGAAAGTHRSATYAEFVAVRI
jgi:hypothetical protein